MPSLVGRLDLYYLFLGVLFLDPYAFVHDCLSPEFLYHCHVSSTCENDAFCQCPYQMSSQLVAVFLFFLAYPIKVRFLFVPFLYPFLYFASYLTVSLLYRETASYISEALEKGKVLNSMLY